MQALAEKLAEGLPIRYGTIVEQVHWGSTGVTVQCQGGEEFHADAVIMTVSLGVLKVPASLICIPLRQMCSACG